MTDAVIWEHKFRGENITLTLADLTGHRMREIKSVFGEKYGIPLQLMACLQLDEVDAVTAALWIHGQKVGRPIDDMLTFEFNLSELEPVDKPKRSVKKADPKGQPAVTSDETPSSETL
jgi:hypothetical protein